MLKKNRVLILLTIAFRVLWFPYLQMMISEPQVMQDNQRALSVLSQPVLLN